MWIYESKGGDGSANMELDAAGKQMIAKSGWLVVPRALEKIWWRTENLDERIGHHLHGNAGESQEWGQRGSPHCGQGRYSTLASDSIWNQCCIVSVVARRSSKRSTDAAALHSERSLENSQKQ